MRYTIFISDGESSVYNSVCNINDGKGPDDGVKVDKGKCINHVGKRLHTALRKNRDQEKKTKREKYEEQKTYEVKES